jgi:hypothetical protein
MNGLKKRITEVIRYIKPEMPYCVKEDNIYHHTTTYKHFGILFLSLNLSEFGYNTVVYN